MSNFRKFISMSAVAVLGMTSLLTPLSYASAQEAPDYGNYDTISFPVTAKRFKFNMPAKDVYLFAVIEANKYFVRYNGGEKTSWTVNTGTFTYDTTWDLAANGFSKLWYTFKEWNRSSGGNGSGYSAGAHVVYNWTDQQSGVVDIYAQWNKNTYNITYDLNDKTGTSSWSYGSQRPTTATYDVPFTVDNPSRQWYDFSGWNITDMDSNPHTVGWQASSATGATGVMGTGFENLHATNGATVKFAARWNAKKTNYTVYHLLQDINNDDVYATWDTQTLSGNTDSTVEPAVKTIEWFTAPSTQTGNIDSDGNKVFTYYYTRDSYNLTLVPGTWVATVAGSGTRNKIDSSSSSVTKAFKYNEFITLSFTPKPWYDNLQWSGYSGTASVFNMPASHITKSASATPITYTITTYPRWGIVNPANKTEYNVETPTFTLNDHPTRDHSTFSWWIGWVNNEITTPTKVVTITGGSINNRTYTAVWDCVDWYHMEHENSEDEVCMADEHTPYTVEHYKQNLENSGYSIVSSDTQNLSWETDKPTEAVAKTYPWFTASGFNQEDIKWDKTTVIKIYYNRLSYDAQINAPEWATDATAINNAKAQATYPDGSKYKHGDTVTLSANIKPWYEFKYWTVTDGSGSITVTNSGNREWATFVVRTSDITITPHVKQTDYTITYVMHSWSVTTPNPEKYTVESGNIILNTPTRNHSTFLWWSGTDHNELFSGNTVAIAKWQVWNKTYEAIWWCDAWYHAVWDSCVNNGYTVSIDLNYEDGTDVDTTESLTYDIEKTIPNPEQSWYTFIWWTITDMSNSEHVIGTATVSWTSTGGVMATKFMNLTTVSGGTVKFTAQWSAKLDTKYEIFHYYKEVWKTTYELSWHYELTWTTNSDVVFNTKLQNYEWFTYSGWYTEWGPTRPSGAGVSSTKIVKDWSTKIYLYYDRNRNHVYLSGSNVTSLSWDDDYEYGATVTVDATPKTWYHFVRWEERNADRSKKSS